MQDQVLQLSVLQVKGWVLKGSIFFVELGTFQLIVLNCQLDTFQIPSQPDPTAPPPPKYKLGPPSVLALYFTQATLPAGSYANVLKVCCYRG
jgi:hypothetical protein